MEPICKCLSVGGGQKYICTLEELMFILNKEMDDNVRGDIKISIKRNEINHEMKSCEDRDDDQDCEGWQ